MPESRPAPERDTPSAPDRPRVPVRVWELGALLVVLALAGVLRLGWSDVVEFRRDEANVSRLALDMARGDDLPLLGVGSSIGANNPPFSVWVFVPPYLFSNDPVPATQYVGWLNVLAVLAVWWIARRYYGPLAAILAALFLAVGPWPVIYSRKIWAQDVLPLFVTLTLASGLLGFVENKRWARFLHLPLLCLTAQIHYATIVIVPATLYLVVHARRRLGRPFWLGFGVAVLMLVPFVIGAVRALAPVAWKVSGFLAEKRSERSLEATGEAFDHALTALGGRGMHEYVGGEAAAASQDAVPNVEWLYVGFGVVMLAACGWVLLRSLRRRDGLRPVDRVFVLAALFAPLAFSVRWNYVHIHYLIPMFPAAFVCFGVAARDVWRVAARRPALRRVALWGGGTFLAAVAGFQVWTMAGALTFAGAHATPEAFTNPMRTLAPVRDAVLARNPAQVLCMLDGQEVGRDGEACVWEFLLDGVPLLRFVPPGLEVFPAEDAVTLTRGCTGDGTILPHRPAHDTGVPEFCHRIGRVGPADFPAWAFDAVDVPAFEAGARVVGVTWEIDTDGAPRLRVAVRVAGPASGPANDAFLLIAELRDARGDVIANGEQEFWFGRYWRDGDVVVATLRLEATADGDTLAEAHVALRTTEETRDGLVVHPVRVEGSDATTLVLPWR